MQDSSSRSELHLATSKAHAALLADHTKVAVLIDALVCDCRAWAGSSGNCVTAECCKAGSVLHRGVQVAPQQPKRVLSQLTSAAGRSLMRVPILIAGLARCVTAVVFC
jgi:hypothetical protein